MWYNINMEKKYRKFYDVIILGKGPSGLSCALYTQRGNMSTLIIGKNEGGIFGANVENFFGVREATKGAKMVDDTVYNLKNLGSDFIEEYAVKIEPQENTIKVITDGNKEFNCTYLVIAVGKNVGQKKYQGGVSYCATCDGYFYRNKIVAVLGNNSNAFDDAKYLSNICQKVYLLTDGEQPKINTEIEVITDKINDLIFENNTLSKIEFNNKDLKVDGLFISEKVSINSMQSFGIITKNGFIKINEEYQTNVKNIFAIGDVVGYPHQIAKAVYDGMVCGMNLTKNFAKNNLNLK